MEDICIAISNLNVRRGYIINELENNPIFMSWLSRVGSQRMTALARFASNLPEHLRPYMNDHQRSLQLYRSSVAQTSVALSGIKRKLLDVTNVSEDERKRKVARTSAKKEIGGINVVLDKLFEPSIHNLAQRICNEKRLLHEIIAPRDSLMLITSVKTIFTYLTDWLSDVFAEQAPRVIFVVGHSGSGKTVAVNIACRNFGAVIKTQDFDQHGFFEPRPARFRSKSGSKKTSRKFEGTSSKFWDAIGFAADLVTAAAFEPGTTCYQKTNKTVMLIDGLDTIEFSKEQLKIYCKILFDDPNANKPQLNDIGSRKSPIIITCDDVYHPNVKFMMTVLGESGYKKIVMPPPSVDDLAELTKKIFSSLLLSQIKQGKPPCSLLSPTWISYLTEQLPAHKIATLAQWDIRSVIHQTHFYYCHCLDKLRERLKQKGIKQSSITYKYGDIVLAFTKDAQPNMLEVLEKLTSKRVTPDEESDDDDLCRSNSQTLLTVFFANYMNFYKRGSFNEFKYLNRLDPRVRKKLGTKFTFFPSLEESAEISQNLSTLDITFSGKNGLDFSGDVDRWRKDYVGGYVSCEMRSRFTDLQADKRYWETNLHLPYERDYGLLKFVQQPFLKTPDELDRDMSSLKSINAKQR